ncbi:MAG: hypothetical protein U0800_17685 [Isosphaeraceae bacterium]
MERMEYPERSNELAIVGAETADHTVPVEVLSRALEGLQRIIYLMAASGQELPISDRFKPSSDLRSRYTLRCGVPRASSFAVPLHMSRTESMLFPEPDPLVGSLSVMKALAEGRWNELNRFFSRPQYLGRVLGEVREILPRAGERWSLRIRVGGEGVDLNHATFRSLNSYLGSGAAEDATMTVTGDLLKVNIEAQSLIIRYPPTRQEIRCQCEATVFDTVMKNYNVPIQVTGQYTLDRKGHPISLTGVSRVEPIDLSAMVFSEARWGGRALRLAPHLTLIPSMDEDSGQYYTLRSEELGIDVFAWTRDKIADEFAEQLMFQWDVYAKASPEKLSRGARRLRQALLDRVREETRDAAISEGR